MRTKILATALVISVALLVYSILPEKVGVSQIKPVEPQSGPISVSPINDSPAEMQAQAKLEELASTLQHYQKDSQEQWRQAQIEQARLSSLLAGLNARLRSVERAGGETEQDTATSSNDDAKRSESRNVSENDLGNWMDEALNVGHVDWKSTDVAGEQAAANLEKVPGIILENMMCGDAFCRATFSSETGEHPELHDLFGQPPFLNEGFTIDQPDGRVTLYFTPPDVSLDDLRSEARQATQLSLSR